MKNFFIFILIVIIVVLICLILSGSFCHQEYIKPYRDDFNIKSYLAKDYYAYSICC